MRQGWCPRQKGQGFIRPLERRPSLEADPGGLAGEKSCNWVGFVDPDGPQRLLDGRLTRRRLQMRPRQVSIIA
jgi:hypothetical protein